MFPNSRLSRIALVFGALIFALALALPPVSFRITDAGVAFHGTNIALVNDSRPHPARGTALHFGGCKFVGQTGLCVHKEVSYDPARGLRLRADVNSRPASGI